MGRTSEARSQILAAALTLIHERGYTAVGIQDICEAAGVKKGSFYHFFPSKQMLALEIIAEFERGVRDSLRRAREAPVSPLRKIEFIFIPRECPAPNTRKRFRGCLFGNLALELATQDDRVRRRLERTFAHMSAEIEAILAEAVEAKQIPADTDLPTTARALVAYLEGIILMAKTQNDPRVLAELGRAALRLAGATNGHANGNAAPPAETKAATTATENKPAAAKTSKKTRTDTHPAFRDHTPASTAPPTSQKRVATTPTRRDSATTSSTRANGAATPSTKRNKTTRTRASRKSPSNP